jgi:hypoxanthine phosphoribosyltransferase
MVMSQSSSINVLYGEAEIADRVDNLAREIVADEPGDLLVVIILKGSFVFAADLIRALERAGASAQVDFVTLSSYGTGTTSTGTVTLTHDLVEDVKGRSILIVDDVLESGRTLAFARQTLLQRGADRVKTCLLLDKPANRKVAIEADYVGFSVGDEFVVGYGLDYAHRFRGLPYIGTLAAD